MNSWYQSIILWKEIKDDWTYCPLFMLVAKHKKIDAMQDANKIFTERPEMPFRELLSLKDQTMNGSLGLFASSKVHSSVNACHLPINPFNFRLRSIMLRFQFLDCSGWDQMFSADGFRKSIIHNSECLYLSKWWPNYWFNMRGHVMLIIEGKVSASSTISNHSESFLKKLRIRQEEQLADRKFWWVLFHTKCRLLA